MKIISNEDGLIGGLEFGKELFKIINKKIKFIPKKKEGSEIKKGDVIAYIIGDIKDILSGERATLNFLSHISGIATETRKFVKAVNKKVKICCTRKTLPGLRSVQKYAVKLGGGTNHRFNLSDEFLIKDNHLALKISIRQIIKKAIKNKKRRNKRRRYNYDRWLFRKNNYRRSKNCKTRDFRRFFKNNELVR